MRTQDIRKQDGEATLAKKDQAPGPQGAEADILALQQTAGNQAVGQMIARQQAAKDTEEEGAEAAPEGGEAEEAPEGAEEAAPEGAAPEGEAPEEEEKQAAA